MGTAFEKRFENPVPVPRWWRSRTDQIEQVLDQVKLGRVQQIARTPGGRPVRAVLYGEPETHLRGRANLNSALGARDPSAFYRRDERRRPVMVVLAGVHGQEFEGMIGALSVISLMERGCDVRGMEQPALRAKLERVRLIVIPLANPDGRARVPYEGWVGLPEDEMHRVGQGTRADGSLYGWPACKAVHPMRNDVQGLGGYFDDAGVNLMHDEFFDPHSAVTGALLHLAREEGPDALVNLHSHPAPPALHQTRYAPVAVQERIRRIAEDYAGRLATNGLAYGPLPRVEPEGPAGTVPPAFNLNSALYHAGADLPFTFESAHGLNTPREVDAGAPGYDQLLDAHHLLFETVLDGLLDR